MMTKSIALAVCIVAMLVVAASGESAAVASLKAKVEAGTAAAPCNKGAHHASGPAPPRQFLDIRLPHVVDDYHPPVGGFNPSDIPSKEVDVAARKILREIQAAEAEAKANGDAPAATTTDGVLTTEEHKALKQLLLDSDILVRAAAKSLKENGPIEANAARKVAMSAVHKAAKIEKKAAAKSAPIKKLAAAVAAAHPTAPAAAAPAAAATAGAAAVGAAVGAVAPAAVPVAVNKAAAATQSAKATLKRVGAVPAAAVPVAVNKAAAATQSAKAELKRVGAVAPAAAVPVTVNKAAAATQSAKATLKRE